MKRINLEEAVNIFRQNHGILRTTQALEFGIAPKTLYKMRDEGILFRESRGLYRLVDMEAFDHPDLVMVSKRLPKAVICLISALAFHGMTTRIPHQVYVALPRGVKKPRLDYPPLFIMRLSGKRFSAGIEGHELSGVPVRVYNREKTVADCFAYRNKIGMDVAIEALKDLVKKPGFQVEDLLHYAHINAVKNVMRPYLETVL